jgi:hypothetical protein
VVPKDQKEYDELFKESLALLASKTTTNPLVYSFKKRYFKKKVIQANERCELYHEELTRLNRMHGWHIVWHVWL